MSKMKRKVIIPIFLLLFLLSSCTSNSKINNSSKSIPSSSQIQSTSVAASSVVTSVVAEPVTGGFKQGEAKSYSNARLKFSLDYLNSWTLKDETEKVSALPASFDINKDMVDLSLEPFVFNETSPSSDYTNTFYLAIEPNSSQLKTDYYAIHKAEVWKSMQDQYNSAGIMSIVNEYPATLEKYGDNEVVVLEYSSKAASEMVRWIEGRIVRGQNIFVFTYSYATQGADPKEKRAIFDNVMLSLNFSN